MSRPYSLPVLALYSLEKPIEWKPARRRPTALAPATLYSLEKPIEWKQKYRNSVIQGEYELLSLYSLEKPIEWKLVR